MAQNRTSKLLTCQAHTDMKNYSCETAYFGNRPPVPSLISTAFFALILPHPSPISIGMYVNYRTARACVSDLDSLICFLTSHTHTSASIVLMFTRVCPHYFTASHAHTHISTSQAHVGTYSGDVDMCVTLTRGNVDL